MADTVQYRLERMSDELDDLERRGLFTRAELAEVVRRRRDFEFRLRRHSPRKADFLDYIAYLLRVDALRDLRKRAIIRATPNPTHSDEDNDTNEDGKKRKKRKKKWAKSISDFAGVLRVLDVYRMATVRFKGDLDLWFRYLEFCRQKGHGRMKQVMAQAIRYHPKVPGLWMYAAAWEFDQNLNVALEDKEDLFWQQGVLIIRTIYHGAMEALPSSLTLRKKILDILNSVELAHSEELRLEVMDDLKKDFSHNEDYWDWLARLQLSDSTNSSTLNKKEAVLNKLNKSIQVYDEAVRKLPTSKMYSLYANFWLGVVFSDREDSISLFRDADFDASEFTSAILQVFENAESCGCLSEDLACQYVSLCLKLGRSEEAPERLEEAKNLAEKLCSGPLSQAANLWNLRASIEIKSLATATGSASFSEENLSSLFDLFNIVLPKLSITKAEGLWHTAMKLFSHEKIYFEKLVKCAMLSLSSAGGSDCGASVSSAFIGWVLQKDGIKQARKMYKRFLALPRPSLKFFQFCIELEANLASIGNNDGLVNARKLYDSAISLYPQERELWRKYYNMELTVGTSETSNAIYWRARKVLNDSTALDIPRS
ncbi:unnamed protein product [Triticum turgidum subsp. durum]|uniref:U3 small nucleolar RNA-associated protein 6 homolog n=1 Tax=Triticum turgidum subsp. durum TaxID=4567 RepID=A0A9R1RMG6_TRITD|nr:unnamed protein product [Triticum turgidum subsp. durum]